MNGEPLSAGRSGSCEERSLIDAESFLNGIEDDLVVEVGVIVVRFEWIAAIVVLDAEMRDSFSKIGLECVDADVHQPSQQVGVPLARFRISEIDDSHPRLPQIPLPNIPVRPLDKVPVIDAFLVDAGSLRDVRIDPGAHLDVVPFLDRLDITFRVGERLAIEVKRTPVVSFHPETVEVEHADGARALLHALEEAGDGLFVVRCGK